MAYLKLMMDEKEIAHLSEDGQSLCANEGVPQYSLPLNLFIGDKREVPLVDVVVWAKKRIFPKNRMDCKEILKMMGPTFNNSKRNKKAVINAYGDKIRIFKESIPRAVTIAETASEGISIFAYDGSGKGAQSYQKLVEGVLDHA